MPRTKYSSSRHKNIESDEESRPPTSDTYTVEDSKTKSILKKTNSSSRRPETAESDYQTDDDSRGHRSSKRSSSKNRRRPDTQEEDRNGKKSSSRGSQRSKNSRDSRRDEGEDTDGYQSDQRDRRSADRDKKNRSSDKRKTSEQSQTVHVVIHRKKKPVGSKRNDETQKKEEEPEVQPMPKPERTPPEERKENHKQPKGHHEREFSSRLLCDCSPSEVDCRCPTCHQSYHNVQSVEPPITQHNQSYYPVHVDQTRDPYKSDLFNTDHHRDRPRDPEPVKIEPFESKYPAEKYYNKLPKFSDRPKDSPPKYEDVIKGVRRSPERPIKYEQHYDPDCSDPECELCVFAKKEAAKGGRRLSSKGKDKPEKLSEKDRDDHRQRRMSLQSRDKPKSRDRDRDRRRSPDRPRRDQVGTPPDMADEIVKKYGNYKYD